MRKYLAIFGALLVATACGSGSGGGSSSPKHTLTIEATGAPSFIRNFNPLSSSANSGSSGLLYEPLLIFTPVHPGVATPWLATKYRWADGGKQLTFTLRDKVQWSDGKPFTSKDVVYTFQTLKKYPDLNTKGITFNSVTAPNASTVVLTFPTTAYARLADIGGITPVPQHTFSSQDPTKFTNPNPVTSGPYKLKSFAAQVYRFTKNPHFWQASKIKVTDIEYPAYSPASFTTALSQGRIDWAGGFVANIDRIYTSKDKAHNKHWFPQDGIVALYLNLTHKPFDDVTLRKAISLAVDRKALSTVAENGYEKPASPTGLVLPAFQSYLSPEYANSSFSQDVSTANKLLDQAGYTKGSDGVRQDKSGKKLAFSLVIPSGYVDWVTAAKLLQSQLKKVGIKVTPQGISAQDWAGKLKNGTFQMAIRGIAAGADPYFMYRGMLSSALSAKVGQPAASNYERWTDPATDKQLSTYANTTDTATRKQAIAAIEKTIVDKLPVIPLLGSANWCEYRTTKFTGWPTPDNVYAMPAPYSAPDNLLVIMHLKPVG